MSENDSPRRDYAKQMEGHSFRFLEQNNPYFTSEHLSK
jgi:hypothetical protein